MDTIANLLIICFILGMAYLWSVYGLFSAFLQLIVVIAAGSFTLAIWETVAIDLGLLDRLGQPGWGVALLGPFVLTLILMRVVCDVIVRKNAHYPRLVQSLGGAVCGTMSAILIVGFAWIGISFLPLGPEVMGIQPYTITNTGQVADSNDGGRLWFAYDHMAASFFNGLSGGAFATDHPLHLYQPQLARQAETFRLHTDDNASLIARPSGVEINKLYIHVAPIPGLPTEVAEALGPKVTSPTNRLVIVDTLWHQEAGTYDIDSALRVAPTQIRLVAWDDNKSHPTPQLFAPLAYSRITNIDTHERTFYPLNTDDADARTNLQSETFGFLFVIPANLETQYTIIRHLRVKMPKPQIDPDLFKQAMGNPAKSIKPETLFGDDDDGPSQVGARTGGQTGHVATAIELTNKLPKSFSTNLGAGLKYHPENNDIRSGSVTVTKKAGGLTKRTRVSAVYVPSHQAAVRLKINADFARSIFGKALSSARALGGVWLTDNRGVKYFPIGYVWYKGGNTQTIHIDPYNKIQSAKQLPVTKMSSGHELYLYFAVPKETAIVSYSVGETVQKIEPPLVTR